jgi:hypothetical protein
MSKLDLMIVALIVAWGVFWIEQDHRTIIEAPAAEASTPAAAAGCPDNDTAPYSARCLEFLNVPTGVQPRLRAVAVREARPAPCPDNDKVPYSASCIAFLKGATEIDMRWRATDSLLAPPASQ